MNYKLMMLLIVFGVMFCMVYFWYNTKSYNKNLYASEQRYVFQIESLKSEIKAQQQIIQKLRENARNYQSLNNAKEQSLSVMRDKMEKLEMDKIKATQEIDRLTNEYKKVSVSQKLAQEREENETQQGIKKYQSEVKKMKGKLKTLNNEYESLANKKKDSSGNEISKIEDQFDNLKKNEEKTQIGFTKKNLPPIFSSNNNDVQHNKISKLNDEKSDKDNTRKTTTQLNKFSSNPNFKLVNKMIGKFQINSQRNKFNSNNVVKIVTGFMRNMKHRPRMNNIDNIPVLRPINGIKRENKNSDDMKQSKIGNEENKVALRHRPNFEMNDNKDKNEQQNIKMKKSKVSEDLGDSGEKESNSLIKKHSNENESNNNNKKKEDGDFDKSMGVLKNPKFINKYRDSRFHGQNNVAAKQALND